MSVFGSLFTAVSGLAAQSQSISMISNNIANVSTTGYKRTDATFSSAVTNASRSTLYSPGSVRAFQNPRIDQQGILQQSSSSTDLALSGNGFFVVKSAATASAEPLYTRSGSFSEDSEGILRNTSGFYLFGWPLDQDGALPASQSDISSLTAVNVASLNNLAQPTTTASLGVNLDATETQTAFPASVGFSPDFTRDMRIYDSLGAGHDLTLNLKKVTSPTSTTTGNTDLSTIVGDLSANGFTAADSFDITVGGVGPTTLLLDGDMADLLADLNAILDGNNDPVVYATLDSNGFLSIRARNPGDQMDIVDGMNTPLAALGLTAGSFLPPTTAVVTGGVDVSGYDLGDLTIDGFAATDTFDVTVGLNAPVTITLSAGMTQLLADLNAVTGMTAALDGNGFLVMTATNGGESITLLDGAGFPLAALGHADGTTAPVGNVSSLTPTAVVPNTEGWWQVEFKTPSGAIVSSGLLNFASDGLLNATADTNGDILLALNDIDWGNGSDLQDVDFNVAAITQFAGDYNVISSNQNGAALGLRTGISIDDDGFVVAQFSNGQSTRIYKLAVATFANPNGLDELTGNAFRQSDSSGDFNLREAGQGSAGLIESGALEGSNVDLAEEFSKMIVTQRAYSANTKVISTADQMTQELLQLR